MHWNILYFLFLIGFLNSENFSKEPTTTIKWAILQGDVVGDKTASTVFNSSANFEECVAQCNSTDMCIVAAQPNSTAPCYLFSYGEEMIISSKCAANDSRIAIRVHTEQPVCELNVKNVINGRTYVYTSENHTESTSLYRVDTHQKGWKISYPASSDHTNTSTREFCGGYGYFRPSDNSCSEKCFTTWVQSYGEISESQQNVTPSVVDSAIGTWEECLDESAKTDCVLKFMRNGVCSCYEHNSEFSVTRTPSLDGVRMAMKFVLNSSTCGMTTDEIWRSAYWENENFLIYIDAEKVWYSKVNYHCTMDLATYRMNSCTRVGN